MKIKRKFLPFIQFADYEPDFVGIRPEFQKPGDGIRYFVINNEKISGYDNLTTTTELNDYKDNSKKRLLNCNNQIIDHHIQLQKILTKVL